MSIVRLATLALMVCALFGAPPALGVDVQPAPPDPAGTVAAPAKPNIVVFYLDDLSPHDGRLWNDPTITPNIHELFVAHGVQFENAIGETPLCCPGRGSVLTGLHTHNHGVTVNDARLFNPGEHLGSALKQAGYETMMIGKYFNWAERLTDAQWQQHAAGWSQLDVFMNDPGLSGLNYFYDYTLFTKQGPVPYSDVHSTRMIAQRAVSRMREAPAAKPIFELLSIFNTHAPNLPLPEFATDPRCDSMAPWNPPNYNEADLSDKPVYMQSFPLMPNPDGWPMVDHCRAMIGVDWLVGQVVDELRAEGRFDNTMFVFTADNGMGWGEHRWDKKRMPYTTPVPLYMNWPARWGNEHRVIDDGTSNIDLAPTFCAYAGCTLGPFPGGQTAPDGISLAPLLDGSVGGLTRDALLESSYGSRSWYAVRTTTASPLGLWHYIVQPTGFEELYDLSADPWELQNRASDPTLDEIRGQLGARLTQLQQEGRVSNGPRPDGSVGLTPDGPFKGVNVYATAPKETQTERIIDVLKYSTHDFLVRIANHGPDTATFTLQGASSGSSRISVRYLIRDFDVTSQMTAGTLSFDNISPGTALTLTVRMIVGKAPLGAKRSAVITAKSTVGVTRLDVVRAVIVRATQATPPPSPPSPPAPATRTTTVMDLTRR